MSEEKNPEVKEEVKKPELVKEEKGVAADLKIISDSLGGMKSEHYQKASRLINEAIKQVKLGESDKIK